MAVVGGERSGKSAFAGNDVAACLAACRHGVAVVGQEYDNCHAEMAYIIDALRKLGGLRGRPSTPKQGQWVAEMRGGVTIKTISIERGPEELTGTGLPFDIVLLVEWGLMRYDTFTAALRRTQDARGRVYCVGTLKDNVGWQVDLYNALAARDNVYRGERFSFPAWENRAVFPGGREDDRIKYLERILTEEEFARTVAAEVRPSPARIYPEFSVPVHVGDVPFDPELPVEVWIDAGYYPSHYAVAAVQMVKEQMQVEQGGARVTLTMEVVRQIDEVWEHHLTHEDVFELCRQRAWWRKCERVLIGHEGKQHQAAASTEEVWRTLARAHGKELKVIVFDAGRVLDGVMRVKTMLKDPATGLARYRCDVGCTGAQYEFGHYKRRTDSRGNVIGDEPKDADNDVMDSLRNGMVERYGLVDREPRKATGGRRRARMWG